MDINKDKNRYLLKLKNLILDLLKEEPVKKVELIDFSENLSKVFKKEALKQVIVWKD